MTTHLEGEIMATFVMGGISKKTNNPYLQVSDGIEAKFVRIPKDSDGSKMGAIFSTFEKGDPITFNARIHLDGTVEILEVLQR